MMALINKIYEKGSVTKAELKTLTILLNPFCPSRKQEEMWDVVGFGGNGQ